MRQIRELQEKLQKKELLIKTLLSEEEQKQCLQTEINKAIFSALKILDTRIEWLERIGSKRSEQ